MSELTCEDLPLSLIPPVGEQQDPLVLENGLILGFLDTAEDTFEDSLELRIDRCGNR